MPAPPPESEPAMVSAVAIAGSAASERRHDFDRITVIDQCFAILLAQEWLATQFDHAPARQLTRLLEELLYRHRALKFALFPVQANANHRWLLLYTLVLSSADLVLLATGL